MKSFYSRVTGSICILSLTLAFVGAALGQKMTTDELGAKHRASIGTKEKLDSVRKRVTMGVGEFESKLPFKKTSGKAVVASRGKDYRSEHSLRTTRKCCPTAFTGSLLGELFVQCPLYDRKQQRHVRVFLEIGASAIPDQSKSGCQFLYL